MLIPRELAQDSYKPIHDPM
jgi:ATP-binding cassette subfamily A (ABC1) protein 3